jgi:hypothetical protein
MLKLIRAWLMDIKYYVSLGDCCSAVHYYSTGTVQGSVLGPVLYAISVSPIFDLARITNFANDNLIIRWNKVLSKLIVDLEKDLEMIVKWLIDSGLVVNSSKTDLRLFHRNDQPEVHVRISGSLFKSNKSMNVLGVIFDCKLDWSKHVALTIKKSNSALFAVKMIKKYFKPNEQKILLHAYYYSVLYYNSEIWLTPLCMLDPKICSCINLHNVNISFQNLHKQAKKSTPEQATLYKILLLL